jgi:cobyrinic acid a,c-diamide synthase
MATPRVLIAGLRGGSGKTLIALALAAAWRRQGRKVAPFKKGPDYIDAAWLSAAAGRPCRNLDLFLMPPQTVLRSFLTAVADADVAVIEGNRGLFDGLDAQGTYSTAELAKLLKAPVLLAVDCTKSTRTVAGCVLGCQRLDPEVDIRGVILNQTAGPRHDAVLREAIRQDCGLPVLGAVARIPQQLFPERHLGLVPPQEHDQQAHAIQQVADLAQQYLDLQAIWTVATKANATLLPPGPEPSCPAGPCEQVPGESPRIGVLRDAAFAFYYPENLEALARQGATVVEISPLRDPRLPEVDALYIGGGFPETLAPSLVQNTTLIDSLRRRIDDGLPVYAECGGAVYLGRQLLCHQQRYPMVGVLPLDFVLHAKAQGHGYSVLETVAENPFYRVGQSIRGHEFHYTGIAPAAAEDLTFAFRVRRGYGFDGRRDGLCRGNVLACYTHVHALGTEDWAPALVRAAARFRTRSVRTAP